MIDFIRSASQSFEGGKNPSKGSQAVQWCSNLFTTQLVSMHTFLLFSRRYLYFNFQPSDSLK
jgi:hypothetical protein